MYKSWYGNQRFLTCTYDAAVFSSRLLPDHPIPRQSTSLYPDPHTYLLPDSGGKFAQCPTGGVVAKIVAAVTVKTVEDRQ